MLSIFGVSKQSITKQARSAILLVRCLPLPEYGQSAD